MPEPEGGAHQHAVDRENRTTAEDGAHTHLFELGDGTLVKTLRDGAHVHSLESPEAERTGSEASPHRHAVVLMSGQRVETAEDGAHTHALMVARTAVDGLHQHVLKVGADSVTSLTPAQFWQRFEPASGIEIRLAADPGDADIVWTKPIITKNEERRLVLGVVMEPAATDTDGETQSARDIEDAAHDFLMFWNIDRKMSVQHVSFPDELHIVESWIQREDTVIDGEPVKAGTWLIWTFVENDDVWHKVKTGGITGFSIGGNATVSPV